MKKSDAKTALALQAGVQWDPEEPELPKRIDEEHLAGPGDRVTKVKSWEEAWRNRREAAARYNAVDRLIGMDEFRADDLPGDTLHNVLDEERERLR